MILFNETKTMNQNQFDQKGLDINLVINSSKAPLFLEEAKEIKKEIQKWNLEQFKNNFKIKEKTLNKTWDFYHSQNLTAPALLAYSGIGYRMINFKTLNLQKNDQFLNDEVFILSAMYGLLNALDNIEQYRLDFTIKVFQEMTLYNFWKNKVTDQIIKQVKKKEEQQILLLCSSEYTKAIDLQLLEKEKVKVYRLEASSKEQKKLTSMDLKKIRGLLLDYCLENKITDYKELNNFRYFDIFEVELDKTKNILKICKKKQFPLKVKDKS